MPIFAISNKRALLFRRVYPPGLKQWQEFDSAEVFHVEHSCRPKEWRQSQSIPSLRWLTRSEVREVFHVEHFFSRTDRGV